MEDNLKKFEERIKTLARFGVAVRFIEKSGNIFDPFTDDPENKHDTLKLHYGDSMEEIENKIKEKEEFYFVKCENEYKKMHFVKLMNRCKS